LSGVGSLGKAQEIGIKNVETRWFYFDDDNLIPRGFHNKCGDMLTAKQG